jgi:hypothetical protein
VVVVATEWPASAALDWAATAPSMADDILVDRRRIVDAAALRVLELGAEEAPRVFSASLVL